MERVLHAKRMHGPRRRRRKHPDVSRQIRRLDPRQLPARSLAVRGRRPDRRSQRPWIAITARSARRAASLAAEGRANFLPANHRVANPSNELGSGLLVADIITNISGSNDLQGTAHLYLKRSWFPKHPGAARPFERPTAGRELRTEPPRAWSEPLSTAATTAKAGTTKTISPHSLRRSFITAALDAGDPMRDVQIAARHADPRTTDALRPSPPQPTVTTLPAPSGVPSFNGDPRCDRRIRRRRVQRDGETVLRRMTARGNAAIGGELSIVPTSCTQNRHEYHMYSDQNSQDN